MLAQASNASQAENPEPVAASRSMLVLYARDAQGRQMSREEHFSTEVVELLVFNEAQPGHSASAQMQALVSLLACSL